MIVADMRQGYIDACKYVLWHGLDASPRGMRTRELIAHQIILENPFDALPTGIGRKVSTRFAAVEAAQLIAGRSFPSLTVAINPNMAEFMEGGQFHGAYGPRIKRAIRRAVENLKHDRDSRQALVNIWSADLDLFIRTRDVPCTLTLQYLIRNDRLIAVTNMRSNDVWWGLAYDAFQFTQLQITIAYLLGIEPGMYVHNAGSFHAYEKDWPSIEELKNTGSPLADYPTGFPAASMEDAQNLATRILMGSTISNHPSVAWYHEKLHGSH